MITLQELIHTLDTVGQTYVRLSLSGDMNIIVTGRGARIFGPFLADGTPLCWINPALVDSEQFKAFMDAGGWNLGGERIWIAPEIQFNISDRTRFWETHRVPPQMDPGVWTLVSGSAQVTLESAMSLEAFNLASGVLDIHAHHTITTLVPDPLRNTQAAALTDGTAYAGIARTVRLSLTTPGSIQCETWCLNQLNPGGVLVIPVTSEQMQATTYFGDPAPDTLRAVDGALRIHLTGRRQYKLGYKAAYMTGRMGYFNTLADGRSYLLIRSFFNDPSSVYCEEPPDQPSVNGHSVHVYNDGGQFGANGEMECNGRTIGGSTGRLQAHDEFILWAYVGQADRLRQIGRILLGVTL